MIKGNEFENIVNDQKESFTGDPSQVMKINYDTSKIEQVSTEWTLFFNITKTTFQQGEFDTLVVAIETEGGSNRLTQQFPITEGIGKIYKNITINPPKGADINQTQIIFYSQLQGRQITVQDVMLIKGTYHSNIPYFKGTKKLGPNLHLVTHNKNLASIKLEEGSIDGRDGENVPSILPYHAIRFKDFTRVTPGVTYVFSNTIDKIQTGHYWTTAICYDYNKKFIQTFEVQNGSKLQFTAPKNCVYVRCRVEGTFDIPNDIYQVEYQLEVGTTATSYIKPQYIIKDITLPQGLGSDQVLLFDKQYGRSVIKKVTTQSPIKLGETVAITDLYDIEIKTYDDETWFSILDDGSFANTLLGSISYDYEIDPEYDPQIESKHYIYILKSGDMIDGKLYKKVTQDKQSKIEVIKFEDSFYGYPDKYVFASDIVRILKQHI